jgi:NAD(P)-dependent dehydrogenase (short-subunit alcohol dehydrogenase family)
MTRRALIVGASRGIGLGLARHYVDAGWRVIATQRAASAGQGLAALADRLAIVEADIRSPDDIDRLRSAVSAPLDLLIVNAGIGGELDRPGALADIIATNAIGPVRVLDALIGQIAPGGVVAVMSSALGSVAGNLSGGLEDYRASKAALNSLTRSFAARHPPLDYALLTLHPGWVRTDMGGPNADIDVATSVDGLTRVIAEARPGPHRFLDYRGQELPW